MEKDNNISLGSTNITRIRAKVTLQGAQWCSADFVLWNSGEAHFILVISVSEGRKRAKRGQR